MIYLTTPHNSSSNFFQEPSFINILWALWEILDLAKSMPGLMYCGTGPLLFILELNLYFQF